MVADGYRKPAKAVKTHLFYPSAPSPAPSTFSTRFSADPKARLRRPSRRTSADPRHAYLSTRKMDLVTSAVVRHRFRANCETKRGNRHDSAQTVACQTRRVLASVLKPNLRLCQSSPTTVMVAHGARATCASPRAPHSWWSVIRAQISTMEVRAKSQPCTPQLKTLNVHRFRRRPKHSPQCRP